MEFVNTKKMTYLIELSLKYRKEENVELLLPNT